MFDIGWGELVVIGIVALIAIGPKELPAVLRTLGQAMAKVKRMANEFQGQFQEAMREAELHDLKKQAEDMTSSVDDLASFDPIADVQKDLQSAVESEPAKSGSSETEVAATEPAVPEAPGETPPPAIDGAPPEPPAPVTSEKFAPAAPPPPKQAGGGA